MFLEEVIEVRDLAKSQCISDFRNIPGAVLQQDLGFLQLTLSNDL